MEVFLRAKIMSMALDLASAVTTRLQPAGSPLGPSTYFTSTHRILTAPRAGLATRLKERDGIIAWRCAVRASGWQEWSGLSSVDISSVANTQNHDLIPLNVKHDTIVADTKSV